MSSIDYLPFFMHCTSARSRGSELGAHSVAEKYARESGSTRPMSWPREPIPQSRLLRFKATLNRNEFQASECALQRRMTSAAQWIESVMLARTREQGRR